MAAYLGCWKQRHRAGLQHLQRHTHLAIDRDRNAERLAGYEMQVSVNPDFVRSDEIKTLYGSPALLESAIGNYREFSLPDTLAWMLGNKRPV